MKTPTTAASADIYATQQWLEGWHEADGDQIVRSTLRSMSVPVEAASKSSAVRYQAVPLPAHGRRPRITSVAARPASTASTVSILLPSSLKKARPAPVLRVDSSPCPPSARPDGRQGRGPCCGPWG